MSSAIKRQPSISYFDWEPNIWKQNTKSNILLFQKKVVKNVQK